MRSQDSVYKMRQRFFQNLLWCLLVSPHPLKIVSGNCGNHSPPRANSQGLRSLGDEDLDDPSGK